jgi:hypothetical protein
VIQVKVSDETGIDHVGQVELLGRLRLLVNEVSRRVLTSIQKSKVWELLGVHHVDTAVKHDSAAAHFDNHAGASDILSRTKRHYLYRHLIKLLTSA